MNSPKVAILYICTGKYSIFWNDFYLSCNTFFLPECSKHYFIFSDTLEVEDSENITRIRQQKLGWPYDTMMRFHLFDNLKESLQKFDFVFFFNANVVFKKPIDVDVLKMDGEFAELIIVKHPFFEWVSHPRDYPYERNRRSTAYIPREKGFLYAFGAVNGGQAPYYIEMIETLKANLDKDLQKKIIPLWHDESHLNHYILHTKKRVKALDYSFGFPEGHDLPLKGNISILIRDKKLYGGHDFLREKKDSIPHSPQSSSFFKRLLRVRKLFSFSASY